MIAQPKPLPTTNAPQEGFVLIVGLVILGLLTMLALSSMRDTTMQEKMAGASRASGLAFQAAESALRDAEKCLKDDAACKFDVTNKAHFAQDDATFPKHNTLFDAATWVAYDPPGMQPSLRESPRTGSITSSARQAPLAAARVALKSVLAAMVTAQQQSPKQSMKSPRAVPAPAARVNRSCAFTIETECPCTQGDRDNTCPQGIALLAHGRTKWVLLGARAIILRTPGSLLRAAPPGASPGWNFSHVLTDTVTRSSSNEGMVRERF